jgi:predicted nucleic acid-binding protein
MTSWVVCDSGIILATVLIESSSAQAKALLRSWHDQNMQLAAPSLFRYEIVAVVRKYVHRGILTHDAGIRTRDLLLAEPVQLMMDDALLRRGYELATRFNRPTAYDTQYLAVAERLQCEFWTADERLANAVKQDLTWVKWLGDFVV